MTEQLVRINQPEKEKRRFVAITSLSKNRWYWIVWPSLDEIRASDEPLLHVGEGVEKTKSEAVERALEMAGNGAEWIAAKYARIHHSNKTNGKRRRASHRTPEDSITLKMDDFLYRDVYDVQSRQWVPVPHRVVRRTRKYIFIEQQPYSPGEVTGSWFDQGAPTFRLDRQMLDREGYAFIPATAYVEDAEEIYFSSEYSQPTESVQIKCLQILNLSVPCTEAEVKGAYRKLVKSAHPDGGGSQEQFLALQEAYEQALRLCLRHPDGTNSSKEKP
jgi:hypothetical protein